MLTLGQRAVRDVRRLLPAWRGSLALEVPGDLDELAWMLEATPGEYDAVAAITTTVDGSTSSRSPVQVVVNSSVLDGLGSQGQQVVISHEAVHVATDAATTSMPLWLMEGFADWVALDGTRLPDSVTAGAVLGKVRSDGAPARLPGEVEFDAQGDQFGTSYEAAWLAVRYLAETYGPERTIDFYDRVDAGVPVKTAFDRLGTTETAFTRGWQRYLDRLADA